MLHPNHPTESRARELDRGTIRQAREAPLHRLRQLQASHERLYHDGLSHVDGCWVCRMYDRCVLRRLREG